MDLAPSASQPCRFMSGRPHQCKKISKTIRFTAAFTLITTVIGADAVVAANLYLRLELTQSGCGLSFSDSKIDDDSVKLVQKRKQLWFYFKIKRQCITIHGKGYVVFISRSKQLQDGKKRTKPLFCNSV